MKRKRLDESAHPIAKLFPFEAFWWGSWQPVERLRIKDGNIWSHVVAADGEPVEQLIPMANLRMRSRKATLNDCCCILRPGIDACVLTTPSDSEDKRPVLLDVKIRSIERKPHDDGCSCEFHISFYIREGFPLNSKKKLSMETRIVSLNQISVLQKLEQVPCDSEDKYYRWSNCEDCSCLQKFRLFNGTFASDLAWLVASSTLKQTIFDVRSIQRRLVYEVADLDGDADLDCSENISYSLTFKQDDTDGVCPVIVEFVPELLPAPEAPVQDTRSPAEPSSLRRSKRRFMQPDRWLACEAPEFEEELLQIGDRKWLRSQAPLALPAPGDDYVEIPCVLSIQDRERNKTDPGTRNGLGSGSGSGSGEKTTRKVSFKDLAQTEPTEPTEPADDEKLSAIRDEKQSSNSQYTLMPQSIHTEGKSILNDLKTPSVDLVAQYILQHGAKKEHRRKISQPIFMKNERGCLVPRYRKVYKRKAFNVRSEWESIYDMKPSGKKSLTAAACRELLNRCMQSIDETIHKEEPAIIDQWKEFQSNKFQDHQKEETEKPAEEEPEEELSEVDMLWKEMEIALTSFYLDDFNEDAQTFPADGKDGNNGCKHDYRLEERIGIICKRCGFVVEEIKDVTLPFWSGASSSASREQRTEEEQNPEHKPNAGSGLEFNVPATNSMASARSEGEENVWALIPGLRDNLRAHQTKAFEFLWTNIAGSLNPALMEENRKKRGGCVISHTPGAGKTLLIITFLVSYLKLFPGSRPLVLAPKTTLYTWYKEIIKWKIPIPVYQIHGGQTYKGEVLRQRMRKDANLPRNQDFMHVLDCLEKMQKWLSHPSVLLMGYTSFLTLTREGSNYAHRKYMAQVLRECPGILILDEGHNPRSTKSRLRKALMKVNTKLRVLLSGTLFQNNFGEYFNTLLLARPIFVKEVLMELDPKYKKEKYGEKSKFSRENRARKIFIDRISKLLNSKQSHERLEGLNILKTLTGGFIDAYEGGSAENLPGLECYTLMMKPTSKQQEMLDKLQSRRHDFKGFPLELELLITLGAIHPWLIRTTNCSSQYFTPEEMEDLEKTKHDINLGSKLRFIMNLIPPCLHRNEKLLIFCHNIAPINLLIELFGRFFGWRKGHEVLVLQGDIELFERGRVMDKFEEPNGPSKIMLASITACAEGISLTAASRVILLDSEWNPSKSKQAIARAFRPGQDKMVYVYQLLAAGTLEEEKYGRTTWKEWVSSMIFSEELVEDPSRWQAPNIEDALLRGIVEGDRGVLFQRIMKIEKATTSSVIREKEIAESCEKEMMAESGEESGEESEESEENGEESE